MSCENVDWKICIKFSRDLKDKKRKFGEECRLGVECFGFGICFGIGGFERTYKQREGISQGRTLKILGKQWMAEVESQKRWRNRVHE